MQTFHTPKTEYPRRGWVVFVEVLADVERARHERFGEGVIDDWEGVDLGMEVVAMGDSLGLVRWVGTWGLG